MTSQDIYDLGRQLADMYRDAVNNLSDHWPDENGDCLGCGDAYPCAEEWITMRAITGIETRWRREAARLDQARRTQTTGTTDVPADKNQREETEQ